MAYIPQDDDEENKDQQQGSEKVLSGESSEVGSAPGSTQSGAAAPKPTNSGGGWTNLTSYVKANEGQDTRMGEAVKGAYGATQTNAQNAQNAYQNNARSAVQSGTVRDNSGVVNTLNSVQNMGSVKPLTAEKVVSAPVTGGGRSPTVATTEVTKNASRGPVQVTPGVSKSSSRAMSVPAGVPGMEQAPPSMHLDLGALAAARNAPPPPEPIPEPAPIPAGYQSPVLTDDMAAELTKLVGGYQGPEHAYDVAGYGDTERGVQDAVAKAAASNDFEGRRGLLKDAYGEPKYSAGEQRLDSFLTGAGTGGRQALDEIQNQSGELKSGWEGLVNQLGGDIDTARTTSGQTATDATKAYQDAVKRMSSGISDTAGRLKGVNDTNSALYKSLTDALASGNPNQRAWAWKQAGIEDPAAAEQLLGLGVPADAIISQAKGQNLGDVLSDSDATNWSELMKFGEAAGMKPEQAFDLAKSGNTGGLASVDKDKLGIGRQYLDTQSGLNTRLESQNKQRESDYEALRRGVVGGFSAEDSATADKLGITAGQLQQAKLLGFDTSKFLSKGKSLNLGDVATDADRRGWTDLLSKLGVASPLNLQDAQAEGAGYSFDKSGFLSALGAANEAKAQKDAKTAADAAAKAAAATPAPAPQASSSKKKETPWYDPKKLLTPI